MGEEKKEYKGQSKIWFWVFSCIGLMFNILDMAAKAGGDYSTDFNGISIIFWVIAGIFLFVWIVTKIVNSNTETQKTKLETQQEQITRLEKQIEELRKKDE